MFTAIFTTILQAFSDILWKKSLNYWVPWKLHDLLSYPVWLLVIGYFFYVWIDFNIVDFKVSFLVFILMLVAIFRTQIIQKIYKEEKISIIMPYTNVNKIIIIISSFFLFSDVSFISLMITIFTIFLIILFSIDFSTFKLPKNIKKLLLAEFILAIDVLIWWWIILTYWEDIYFILTIIIGIIILLAIVLDLWQFNTMKWLPKSFWLNRFWWWLSWVSWFLSLVLIKNLGLSISILLSFLWVWSTLFLAYIILKDKPWKKDLVVTFLVMSLVWLWFYFK